MPFWLKTFKALSFRNAVWWTKDMLQILWLAKLSSGPLVCTYFRIGTRKIPWKNTNNCEKPKINCGLQFALVYSPIFSHYITNVVCSVRRNSSIYFSKTWNLRKTLNKQNYSLVLKERPVSLFKHQRVRLTTTFKIFKTQHIFFKKLKPILNKKGHDRGALNPNRVLCANQDLRAN